MVAVLYGLACGAAGNAILGRAAFNADIAAPEGNFVIGALLVVLSIALLWLFLPRNGQPPRQARLLHEIPITEL